MPDTLRLANPYDSAGHGSNTIGEHLFFRDTISALVLYMRGVASENRRTVLANDARLSLAANDIVDPKTFIMRFLNFPTENVAMMRTYDYSTELAVLNNIDPLSLVVYGALILLRFKTGQTDVEEIQNTLRERRAGPFTPLLIELYSVLMEDCGAIRNVNIFSPDLFGIIPQLATSGEAEFSGPEGSAKAKQILIDVGTGRQKPIEPPVEKRTKPAVDPLHLAETTQAKIVDYMAEIIRGRGDDYKRPPATDRTTDFEDLFGFTQGTLRVLARRRGWATPKEFIMLAEERAASKKEPKKK